MSIPETRLEIQSRNREHGSINGSAVRVSGATLGRICFVDTLEMEGVIAFENCRRVLIGDAWIAGELK